LAGRKKQAKALRFAMGNLERMDRAMSRVLYLLFGTVAYLIFFATFLYMIAFVGNLPGVPKTIDRGPETAFGATLAINLGLIALFGVQHSVMARPGFKAGRTSARRRAFSLRSGSTASHVAGGSMPMSSALVAAMLLFAEAQGLPPAPQWRADAPAPAPADPLTIPRSPDGQFYVNGLVNGVSVRFIVDTGASTVMLTRHDAGRVGLNVESGEFTSRARTAGGYTPVAPVRLQRIALGDREARNVPAVVSSVDLGVSLLGMSYLQRLRRVTIEDDVLRLE
jgi:clan AA aspartic protease (TIGR02281 family)